LKRLLLPALAALAVLAAGTAGAQLGSHPGDRKGDFSSNRDEDRNWRDIEVKLPAYPKADGLISFSVSDVPNFRFFIDAASISVESGGEVRYTLVARSPSGVDNVSYESVRCNPAGFRAYAQGYDGRWVLRPSERRDIEPRAVQRWHFDLHRYYFCPSGSGAILSVAEGLEALRNGGHPSIRSTQRAR
jgi:hypothetical protein